jgi:hypothetical protein
VRNKAWLSKPMHRAYEKLVRRTEGVKFSRTSSALSTAKVKLHGGHFPRYIIMNISSRMCPYGSHFYSNLTRKSVHFEYLLWNRAVYSSFRGQDFTKMTRSDHS